MKMKFLISLSIVFFLAAHLSGSEPDGSTFRVLTYNIHHGEGTDGQVNLQRIAALIDRLDPDFVALQEVDRNTHRTGNVDQTAELARLTNRHGYFFKQIDYDGGEYGQAILAKTELIQRAQHMLPGTPEREQRLLGRGLFELYGTKLWFATTHLHHANDTIREGQVEAINQLFSTVEQPAILCGDFNAVPQSHAMQAIAGEWKISGADQALLTFPAEKPTRQLDYVIVRPANEFRIISITVVAEGVASDHRPLLVELAITP